MKLNLSHINHHSAGKVSRVCGQWFLFVIPERLCQESRCSDNSKRKQDNFFQQVPIKLHGHHSIPFGHAHAFSWPAWPYEPSLGEPFAVYVSWHQHCFWERCFFHEASGCTHSSSLGFSEAVFRNRLCSIPRLARPRPAGASHGCG